MKRFWKNIAIALALPLFMAACTTDYPEPDANGLPQASDLDVTIAVDQETNYVTFTLNNRGMVPLWIFGEEKVDGKANKSYAYTQNGIALRFREAGEHSVEVKAYNANGISIGSKIATFELENEYRDPFDETPYKNAISNNDKREWVWNSSAAGHFGCGDPNAATVTGLDWWSASADEKAGWSLYDDVLTFNVDGTYTYDPTDGQVYVNKGSGYKPEYYLNDENDYVAPIEKYDAKYWFEQNWNDAGIEEIYLCFDEGTNVSYIPHQDALDTPRYKLVETAASALRKEIKMYIANADIVWFYNFVPKSNGEEASESFNGVGFSNGMVETALAQGDEIEVKGIDLTSIWIDPDFFTLSGDKLKFNAVDGEYRVLWDNSWLKVLPLKNGEPATYENNGDLWIIGDGGGKPSMSNLIGWTTENALPCARIDEKTYRITLYMKAEGGSIKVFGQANWGVEWKKANYGTVTGNGLFDIPEDDGNIATDGATAGLYTFTFVDNGGTLDMTVEAAQPVGPTLFDPASAANMWPATCTMDYYFAQGDSWTSVPNPDFEQNGGVYTITMNDNTDQQWQGQVKFTTDMASSAGKNYDFYISITCTKDHPGVTVKLVDAADDGNFYFDGRHKVTADEEFVFKAADFPGKDIGQLRLVLDFGGCQAGTVATVKDIIFQEHQIAEME